MIEVRSLVKYYGNFPALKGVSFTVRKGEILGFLGPNAAGKTTTMRIITGYLPPTAGEVKINGLDIFDNSLEVKKLIGYLPENPLIYPEMRVIEYLYFIAEIKGIPRRERRRKVEEAMEKTKITDVAYRLLGQISRGYKQRVGLAQAIVHDPPLLVLDEPTLGLDPKQIREVRELIRSWKGERTIILSSHILPEVQMISDRVLIIDKGEIKAEGTPDKLSEKISQSLRYHLKIKNFPPVKSDKVKNIPGVKNIEVSITDSLTVMEVEVVRGKDLREDIFRKVVDEGGIILEFRPVEVTLEDIFLRLTTEETL